MFRQLLLVASVALLGTSCLPEDAKYSCTADTDCLTGYTCLRAQCVKQGDPDPCIALNNCPVTDPCATATCDADATCSVVDGAAKCTCKDTFVGDGTTCEPQADCTVNNGGCASNATCAGDPGAVTCTCPAGYEGDGKTCTCAGASKAGDCVSIPVTSGLVAHFSARHASSITKDASDKVTAWNDLSGAAHHLTTTDGPTWKADGVNGLPGLDFAGSKKLVSSAFALTKQVTVFLVLRQGTPDDGGTYAAHGDVKKDWAVTYNASESNVGLRTNDEVTSTDTALVAGSEYVLSARLANFRNFAAITGGSTVAVTGTSSTTISEGSKVLYLGANEFGEGSNATIGELVYFDRALTNAERGQVIAWLGTRWGIRACADGTQDNDLDGVCKPDCATAGVTGCDVNASCSDATGTATCTCAPNFAGDGTTCKACDPCSANGRCDAGPAGSGECLCNTGYDGDDCSACAANYEMVAGGICRTGRTVIVPGTAHQGVSGMVGDRNGFVITGNTNGGTSNFYGGQVEHSWGYDTAFLLGHDASGKRTFATRVNPNQRFHPQNLARDADGNLYMIGWAYASEVLVTRLADVTGAVTTQPIDSFEWGAGSLSAGGNPTYAGYSGPGPVGFFRELYARDGHSAGGCNITVDNETGSIEFWGTAGAPQQVVLYGDLVGSIYPGFGDPSPNRGNALTLVRSLDEAIEIEVERLPPHAVTFQVEINTNVGRYAASTEPLVVGTNRLSLSSFAGLTADGARTIRGLSFSTGVKDSSRGQGLLVREFRIGPAEVTTRVKGVNGGFVLAFDKDGRYRWKRNFGNEVHGVATDLVGNVYIAGYGGGTINFGGEDVPGIGGQDALLASYTSDGTLRWGKVMGGTIAGHAVPGDFLNTVTTDADGNVYIGGYMGTSGNFGGQTLTCQYDACAIVASYDSEGTHRWSKGFARTGTSGWSGAQRMTTRDGILMVAGYFRGEHDFGGGPFNNSPGWENQNGAYLLALGTTSGNYLNHRVVTSGLGVTFNDLEWDVNGDLHTVGWIDNGGADLGGGELVGKAGAFRAIYSKTLEHKSSQVSTGAGARLATQILAFADGTEFAVGVTNNQIDWGYGLGTTTGGNDLWFTWFP